MANAGESLTRLVLSIDGMTCSACSSAIESAVNALPAVKSATVALLQSKGEVVYNTALADERDIVGAIEDAGFDAAVISRTRINRAVFSNLGNSTQVALPSVPASASAQLTRLVLSIDGMTCSACSSAIEFALNALPAVTSATVALLQNRGEVVFDSALASEGDIVSAVEDAGFEAAVVSRSRAAQAPAPHSRSAARASGFSLLLPLQLFQLPLLLLLLVTVLSLVLVTVLLWVQQPPLPPSRASSSPSTA